MKSASQNVEVPGLAEVIRWATIHAERTWRKSGQLARIVVSTTEGAVITIDPPPEDAEGDLLG